MTNWNAQGPTAGVLVAGRYRITSLLGEGGMASVFEATDEKTNESVALKMLRVGGAGNAERFIREAKLAFSLSSAHVPKFIDSGGHEGNLFIAMERLRGTDYGARIRLVGPLELSEVADCIVQACEALSQAHVRNIVHRDIKASNLFLHTENAGGNIVKVLDFGVSKILAESANDTEHTLTGSLEGGVLGSPPYMSPEQVRDPRKVDSRSDLWSLGIVAHRLLSGQQPFPGSTTGEILAAILEREAPSLSAHGVRVPPRVEQAVLRCLARKREDRFANVAELAFAFAPFISPRWQELPNKIAKTLAVAPPRLITAEPTTSTMTNPSGKGAGSGSIVPPTLTGAPVGNPMFDTGPSLTGPVFPMGDASITGPQLTRTSFTGASMTGPPFAEPPPTRARTIPIVLAILAVGALAGGGGAMLIARRSATPPPPTASAAPPPAEAPPASVTASAAPAAPAASPPASPEGTSSAGLAHGKRPQKPVPGAVGPKPTTAAPPAPGPAPAPAAKPSSGLHPNPYD